MSLQLNVGEWSEIYVASVLVATGKLAKMNDGNYDLLGIRSIGKEYTISIVGDYAVIKAGSLQERIPRSDFKEFSHDVKKSIIRGAKGKGSFPVPNSDEFLKKTAINMIRGSSSHRSDLGITAVDSFSKDQRDMTFSVKSLMGSPPTLLNVSNASGIKFELVGNLSSGDIDDINDMTTVRERIRRMAYYSIKLKYSGYVKETFRKNLSSVDTLFPEFYAYSVLAHFSGAGRSKLRDIIYTLESNSNTGFKAVSFRTDFSQLPLTFKFGELLLHATSGMTSARPWNGNYDVSGGYIIVDKNGGISCLTYVNTQELRNYLLDNSSFDTPGTNRHNYGCVWSNSGTPMITLIAQIRFSH